MEKSERERELEGRVIELECALKWWVNECMKNFTDSQYGKGAMKKLIAPEMLWENNPLK
jgi:hypothetical protein